MARPRSPNRDKALQLWLESKKKRQLKDIAAELQVSEQQVRKWKNLDKWDKVTLPNSNSNVTIHKMGPPKGNKNAIGNDGGAPEKNKNAVKTGEFETLFFDTLEEDEKQLIGMIEPDKERLLLQEIQLLTVRERRMLKRIENLKHATDQEKIVPGMTAVKYKSGIDEDTTEYAGILGQIQSIEDALTRVQARKQKAIDSLHRYGYDDSRLELEMIKVELETMKHDNTEQETEDDGFMKAMNDQTVEVWNDEDG